MKYTEKDLVLFGNFLGVEVTHLDIDNFNKETKKDFDLKEFRSQNICSKCGYQVINKEEFDLFIGHANCANTSD
jgi:hypothetical protein|tara:strand:- start:661 stop:882 length:222 start_codon:yes stop_codon:yes gene_type:complete